MSGPWEKYQSAPAIEGDGPWAKYAKPEAVVEQLAAVPEPVARRPRVAKLPAQEAELPPVPTMDELGQKWARVPGQIDDGVRALASGATFGWADEIAAGANAALGQGDYATNVAAERARDATINPNVRLAGDLVGGMATGSALAKNGITLLNTAKPTYGSMIARGAGEGAAYGAAYGAGTGEGARDSAERAVLTGGLGAVGGAALGAVGAKMAQRPKEVIPSVQDLKTQANAAYKAAEDAGVVVSKDSFGTFVDDVAEQARVAGLRPRLHPKAHDALEALKELKGGDQSLQELEIARRIIKGAAKSPEPDERRVADLLLDKLDDYVSGIKKADLVGGDEAGTSALFNARDLWTKKSKGETIETLMTRATERAAQFSGSGTENAIRTEFRQLAMNEKKMRLFTQEEQDAIRKVGRGGPLENAMRTLGKFAPTGVVSSVLSGGAGAALGGGAGAVALPAAGMAARQAATALTRRNAQAASELMRLGRAPIGPRALLPEELALGRSLMIGLDQQAPSLLPQQRRPSLMNTGR